jgi:hypothetical protein
VEDGPLRHTLDRKRTLGGAPGESFLHPPMIIASHGSHMMRSLPRAHPNPFIRSIMNATVVSGFEGRREGERERERERENGKEDVDEVSVEDKCMLRMRKADLERAVQATGGVRTAL